MKSLLKQNSLHALLSGLSIISLASCSASLAQDPDTGSGLSEVKLTLPTIPGVEYDGYYFSANRGPGFENNNQCSPNYYVGGPKAPSVNITHSVKNGCDYIIVLELGMYDATTKVLKQRLYSNVTATSQGELLPAAKLTGNTVSLTLKLSKLNADQQGPNIIQTPGETNLDIQVLIGDGPQPQPIQPQPIQPQPGPNDNTPKNVSLTNGSGQQQKLSDLFQGDQYLVLDFSAAFCGGCVSLAEDLAKQEKIGTKCRLVTVIETDDYSQWKSTLSNRLQGENLARALSHSYSGQDQSDIADKFGFRLNSIPFTILVDRSFTVHGSRAGGLPAASDNLCK